MFLENYEIAINDNLLKEVEAFVDQPEAETQVKATLRVIAKGSKYCQAIKQKYSSRFEVEEIWEKIIAWLSLTLEIMNKERGWEQEKSWNMILNCYKCENLNGKSGRPYREILIGEFAST